MAIYCRCTIYLPYMVWFNPYMVWLGPYMEDSATAINGHINHYSKQIWFQTRRSCFLFTGRAPSGSGQRPRGCPIHWRPKSQGRDRLRLSVSGNDPTSSRKGVPIRPLSLTSLGPYVAETVMVPSPPRPCRGSSPSPTAKGLAQCPQGASESPDADCLHSP